MASRRVNPVVTMIIGILFIVGGFFALKYGQKSINTAKASTDWPSVQGVVAHSEVVRSRDSDGDTTYKAEVIYDYVVNGESLESNKRRIGATSSSSNSSGAYKVTRKYPKASDVTVYYNPEAPEEAVLEPGVFIESKILWYVGLVLMIIGVLMAGGIIFKILLVGGFLIAKR